MTTSTAPSVTPEEAAVLADQAAPLDALLIDAALGSARRFVPDLSTAKLGVALVRKPRTTARRLGSLVAETGRIAIGTSTVTPSRRDRRFADAAWTAIRCCGASSSFISRVRRPRMNLSPTQTSIGGTTRGCGFRRRTSSRPYRRAMFRL